MTLDKTVILFNNTFKDIAAEDLQAEVIASRREAADWTDNQDFGPGRITHLELNQEKIYYN